LTVNTNSNNCSQNFS